MSKCTICHKFVIKPCKNNKNLSQCKFNIYNVKLVTFQSKINNDV